jgi:hypothetical protein
MMMKQIKSFSLFATGLMVVVVLNGCVKRNEDISEDSSSAESITELTERATEEVSEAMIPLPVGGGGPCAGNDVPFGTCATITDSGEGVYPRTVVVNFGTECTGPNGITRSGVVTLVATGDILTDEGSTWTVTFADFEVGNRTVNGTKIRTFTGLNSSGQPTYSFTSDLSITRNGLTYSRETEGTSVWISGYNTEECFDNVVHRNGTATVTSPQGGTRTHTLTEVVHDQNCGYPVSGITVIERPGPNVNIDYGDGTCDNTAIVTRGNHTFLLNLDTHELTPQ